MQKDVLFFYELSSLCLFCSWIPCSQEKSGLEEIGCISDLFAVYAAICVVTDRLLV